MILPDYLKPGLAVVFCGTAAGDRSAERGHFYAGRGNRFWPMLHQTGLTPLRLRPDECHRVMEHGIGPTNLVKHHSGSDASLTQGMFDISGFEEKIRANTPRFVAFNGKKGAQTYWGIRSTKLDYGLHQRTIGSTRVFVLPSTSMAANGSWSEEPWHDLADLVAATKK